MAGLEKGDLGKREFNTSGLNIFATLVQSLNRLPELTGGTMVPLKGGALIMSIPSDGNFNASFSISKTRDGKLAVGLTVPQQIVGKAETHPDQSFVSREFKSSPDSIPSIVQMVREFAVSAQKALAVEAENGTRAMPVELQNSRKPLLWVAAKMILGKP